MLENHNGIVLRSCIHAQALAEANSDQRTAMAAAYVSGAYARQVIAADPSLKHLSQKRMNLHPYRC
jgi:hypothetical protein